MRVNFKFPIKAALLLQLFLSIVFPTIFPFVTAALILFGVLVCLPSIHIFKERSALIYAIFFSLMGLAFCIEGLFSTGDSRAFWYNIVTYSVFPVVVFFLSCLYKVFNDKEINNILRIFAFGLCLYIFLLYFNVGNIGTYSFLKAAFDQNVYKGEYSKIQTVSVSSLLFLIPWFILHTFRRRKFDKSVIFDSFLIALLLIAVFLTGRRSFYMEVPVVGFFLFASSNIKTGKKTFFLVVFSILFYFFYSYILVLFNQGDNTRNAEALQLWNSFSTAPFFGHGFGYYLSHYIRDSAKPWNYELSYLSLLMQIGFFGLLVYFGFAIKLLSTLKKYGLEAWLIALLCMLIVHSTNPYLTTFDVLWMFALPISRILLYEKRSINLYQVRLRGAEQ